MRNPRRGKSYKCDKRTYAMLGRYCLNLQVLSGTNAHWLAGHYASQAPVSLETFLR